jgi:IPT/TIG domain
VGTAPISVSSDGTHVWVTNSADNTVTELNTTGSVVGFRIATSSLPSAAPGVAYGPITLQEAGAGSSTSPYATTVKWKKLTLPKGLKLSSAGVLSGTPSSKLIGGPSAISVQVTEMVTTLNGKRKVKTNTTVQATIPLTIIQPPPTVTSIHKTSGPSAGGTTVSIKGANLQGASVVTFGAVDATSSTVNGAGTAITAITPEEPAGPVDVRVTTPGGTSSTSSADVFTSTP